MNTPSQDQRNYIYADKKNKNFYKIAVVALLIVFILLIVFAEFIIPDSYTVQLSQFQCQLQGGTLTTCYQLDLKQGNVIFLKGLNLSQLNIFSLIQLTLSQLTFPSLNKSTYEQKVKFKIEYYWRAKEMDSDLELVNSDNQEISINCAWNILWCSPKLAYSQDIKESGIYEIKLTITNSQEIFNFAQFVGVLQYSFTKQFSQYQIALRTVFLVLSIIAFLIYFIHYWKNKDLTNNREHKLILILSFSLILFNDPFMSASLVNSSTFWLIISSLNISQFVAFLVFFWAIMFMVVGGYEHIISQRRGIALSLTVSALSFVVFYTYNLYHSLLNRFSLSYQEDTDSILGFNVIRIIYYIYIFLLMLGIDYGCYLSFIRYQQMGVRYQTFLVLSLYIFVMFILSCFDGFLLAFETGLIKELLTVVFMNFYVYSLQIFWRVTNRPDDRLFATQGSVDEKNLKDIKSYNFFNEKGIGLEETPTEAQNKSLSMLEVQRTLEEKRKNQNTSQKSNKSSSEDSMSFSQKDPIDNQYMTLDKTVHSDDENKHHPKPQ